MLKNYQNIQNKILPSLSALALLNASVFSGIISAQSQATVEEIVVTARKNQKVFKMYLFLSLRLEKRHQKRGESMYLRTTYYSYLELQLVVQGQEQVLFILEVLLQLHQTLPLLVLVVQLLTFPSIQMSNLQLNQEEIQMFMQLTFLELRFLEDHKEHFSVLVHRQVL